MTEINSYEGGVFSPTLANGRAGAMLTLGPAGVSAKTPTGEVLEIPYAKLTLTLGGASGHMLFCRLQGQDPTLFTDDTRLLQALTSAPNTAVAMAAQQLVAGLRRSRLSGAVLWLVLLGLVVGAVLAVPPLIKWALPKAVNAVPWSADEQIGKTLVKAMDLGGAELKNDKTIGMVQALVDALAPHTARPAVAYRVHLVANDQVNAFALPGGELVVNTGLIETAKEPSEIAAVLAHEMGHVTSRHGLERIGQSLGVIGGLGLLFGDVGGLVGTAKEVLTLAAVNKYSQGQEEAADAAAVATLHAAGFDANALTAFFTRMKEDATMLEHEALNWLSSHPDFDSRIAAVNALRDKTPVAKAEPPTLDLPALKARIARPGERDDGEEAPAAK